jgi:DNA-binding MarR family transcriptional regulator
MTGVRQPSVVKASSAGLDTEALQQLVGYNARRAALHLIEAFMQSMAAYGLRPVEFSVLSVVVHNPGVTSSQLSQALDLLAPNLVRLVQRLERRGLLRRQRAPTDRRAIGLYATDRGARLLKNAQSAALNSEQHMLAHLSAEEKDTLIGLLRRVYT